MALPGVELLTVFPASLVKVGMTKRKLVRRITP
jgi:hypothetical protein